MVYSPSGPTNGVRLLWRQLGYIEVITYKKGNADFELKVRENFLRCVIAWKSVMDHLLRCEV
jgi:hypothetical protein